MKNTNQKQWIAGLAFAGLALILVFLTEQIWKPGYFVKSAVKLALFGGAIVLYALLCGRKVRDVISLKRPGNVRKLLACILLFFFGIAILFLLFRSFLRYLFLFLCLSSVFSGLSFGNGFFRFQPIVTWLIPTLFFNKPTVDGRTNDSFLLARETARSHGDIIARGNFGNDVKNV